MCKMSQRSTLWFCFILFLQTLSTFIVVLRANDEVKIEVTFLPENCTQKAKRGDMLNAHYDGYLAKDRSQFYCSRSTKTGHPHWFVLGVGSVIKGLDLGLRDMCPGEKRTITIPPSLAYGEHGKGPVPADATVIFEVELLYITRGPRSIEAFSEIDTDNNKVLTKEEIKTYLKMEAKKLNSQKDESYFDDVVADVFLKNDNDADGILSLQEYNVYNHDEL
ncbi:peptidyl-prolyl cis-trans isomerase FKBP7 [Triplophysa rosa]|uniref:peptidylprolyl isomerase n=1 Tax=Triplophysa rosa TaxID=992332 RepID=A0A9W8C6A2_TRIRA|nr:peptidyl-prolyl cis-trans isomerase FKBP7 [Triplophysa rosa]KAI7808585.1 peptidyl-prolyl cis-trans isomerase FKBP7 precursor [Triplophysa rosa]